MHETSCGHVQSQNEKKFLIKFCATQTQEIRESNTKRLARKLNELKVEQSCFHHRGTHTHAQSIAVCVQRASSIKVEVLCN